MANDMRMPSGSAGITRYFDEYRSAISIKPEHVILMCIVVGVLVVLLHIIGTSLIRGG